MRTSTVQLYRIWSHGFGRCSSIRWIVAASNADSSDHVRWNGERYLREKFQRAMAHLAWELPKPDNGPSCDRRALVS
jgi:hypothetical protein